MLKTASSSVLRFRSAADKLIWGLFDLRGRMVARGLWPGASVVAVMPGGERWRILSGACFPLQANGSTKPATALLVPEADCLWGRLHLPEMPRRALDAAVAEAMWRVSPLPPDQVVMAWRAEPDELSGWQIRWGLCEAKRIESMRSQLSLGEEADCYLLGQDRQAFALSGDTATRSAAAQRRRDVIAIGVLALTVAAFCLPAMVPLVSKRQDVVRAMRHVTTVEPMAAPLRQKLDELHARAKVLDELREEALTNPPLAQVLDQLARSLPDNTWLDKLETSGDVIRIMGLTDNAADLIALLERDGHWREVRATAPTVRDDAQKKERFAFEFRWRGAKGKS
jgi:general secretion pathway protein L